QAQATISFPKRKLSW
nr:Chain B, GLN-ALA-GLN-ALA-THR-ILE-SER-PHE-PRO-LYS-ARG-LYS-LEU-SER-TRP [Homo sapiens]